VTVVEELLLVQRARVGGRRGEDAVARRVRSRVAYFSMDPDRSAVIARHRRDGGRCYVLRRGQLLEWDGDDEHDLVDVADLPIALGGLARHNVANALAAAGGARGLGATRQQVADGLRDFRPSADLSPGRMNLFRLGRRTVIVDFAHNEAGVSAVLDVAEGIAGGAAGRASPITAIIGTAGDRPDDTLRGIGKIAGKKAILRSVDQGATFARINDDDHQFAVGTHIAGDPRVEGRVYVGTGGRGIFYGTPAASADGH